MELMNRSWRRLGVLFAIASVRCGSASSPTAPRAAAPATTAVAIKGTADPSAVFLAALNSSRVRADAVIDGFRVHPDPGADGIIQLTEGDPLVINAAGLASVPPAPQTYLIVNWGDDGNERTGCGSCRLVHRFVAGRYTVVATTDDLQPQTPGTAPTTRSITLTVVVAPAVAPAGALHRSVSPFAGFGFQPPFAFSPGGGQIFIPTIPDDVTIDSAPLVCTPSGAINVAASPTPAPGGVTLAYTAVTPGTCTITIDSHDAAGDVFHDVSTLAIIPFI
jgi:hypothetical protein